MAAFIHLPKPLRPDIRWPDCLHGFQVGKGKQINLAVVPGQTLGLQVGESPTEPRLVLMRAACQGRAAFSRSPGAQSPGGRFRARGRAQHAPPPPPSGWCLGADLKLRQSLQRVPSTCSFPARLRVPRAAAGRLRAVSAFPQLPCPCALTRQAAPGL